MRGISTESIACTFKTELAPVRVDTLRPLVLVVHFSAPEVTSLSITSLIPKALHVPQVLSPVVSLILGKILLAVSIAHSTQGGVPGTSLLYPKAQVPGV